MFINGLVTLFITKWKKKKFHTTIFLDVRWVSDCESMDFFTKYRSLSVQYGNTTLSEKFTNAGVSKTAYLISYCT